METKIDGRRRYFTVGEVAVHLGVGASTVRRQIRKGNLAASRFGNTVRIHVDELASYEEKARKGGW